MKINWSGSWSIIEDLITHGFKTNTRHFQRSQAFTLINAFLRNKPLQESAPHDLKRDVISTLCDKIIAEFNQYIDGSSDTKPRFLCEMLNITHGLHLVGASAYVTQWNKVIEVLEIMRNHIPKNRHFHDVKKSYNKACAPLKLKVIQGCEKR